MKLINLTDHVVSQWSLTFEVRKSPRHQLAFPDGSRVAMEPDL